MEELIGDITDEYDEAVERREIDEVDGLTTIEEFAELTGFVIPEGPYDTVAGFFMAETGRLPEVGSEATVSLEARAEDDDEPGVFTLTVTALDGRRASWFALKRLSDPDPAEEGDA